jgi:hypothetical protein
MRGVGGSNSSTMERRHKRRMSLCDVRRRNHVSEMWQPIAKNDKNRGKSAKEILELVAAALR